MTKDVKDEEMICGLTADERDALRNGLLGLPDTMPPRAVWHRIREQAEASINLVPRRQHGGRYPSRGAGCAGHARKR
jgi:hypothetical protein